MPVQIVEPAIDVSAYVWWGSFNVLVFLGQVTMVVFLVYFLLAAGTLYRRKLVRVTGPTLAGMKRTIRILDAVNEQIAAFLLNRVLACAVVAGATWLVFRLVGLEEAAVWGIAAGFLNFIPYVGPITIFFGSLAVALMQFEAPGVALVTSGSAFAIASLEGMLLTPWLVGRTSRMNEVAVFVSLLFWGWLWGLWGFLLAVPLTAALKAVADHVESLQPLGELLGD